MEESNHERLREKHGDDGPGYLRRVWRKLALRVPASDHSTCSADPDGVLRLLGLSNGLHSA